MRQQEMIDTGDSGDTRDAEITLGIGKLLVLFFALVILCGISLAVGYSLGRNSAKQAAAAAAATAQPASPAPSPDGKPGAAQVTQPKTPDSSVADNTPQQTAAAPSTNDLTFYQAVQQKDPHSQLTPKAETPAPPTPAPAQARTSLGNGYLVQIAAVSNQDDATALREQLQKQHYPVVVISQPGDKLLHVQVGPYADIKEAEAIRTRLLSAGFSNAFLKR
jgi:DedD protein